MALTATVTKKSVDLTQKDLYSITLNLILKEGTTEVLNQDFNQRYRTGDVISGVTNKFIAQMQTVINEYKAEQVIFNHAQLSTAITNISNGLSL